jgi:histidine kinase
MRKFQIKEWLFPNQVFHQAILNLMGNSEDPCVLKGEVYNEQEMLPLQFEAKESGTLWDVYLNKLILCYLFDEPDKAAQNAVLAKKYEESALGTYSISIFCFYESLSLLSASLKCSSDKHKIIMKKVNANQKKLKKLADHAPMNFLHKFYLVEAEKARVLQNNIKAIDYYDKAIELAAENKYLQEEALSNELAAKFYIVNGKTRKAKIYMQEALYCYKLWGASAKVKQLLRRTLKEACKYIA